MASSSFKVVVQCETVEKFIFLSILTNILCRGQAINTAIYVII